MLVPEGLSVPPSKLSVAVEPVPRPTGKAGSVTTAVPPMVIVEATALPAERLPKLAAEKVPPVTENAAVELAPLAPLPPMVSVALVDVPPVWL